MEKFNAIKEKLASIEKDANEFYNKQNNAAGTRLRKGLLDLKNLAQDARVDVMNIRKS